MAFQESCKFVQPLPGLMQAVCSMSSLGSFSLSGHLNHFFVSFPWLVGNEEGAEAQGASLGFCKVGACGSNQEDTYVARPFGKYYLMLAFLEIFLKYILDGSSKVDASITNKKESLHLFRSNSKELFSCEEKQILTIFFFFVMNMEITTNFEVVKLG